MISGATLLSLAVYANAALLSLVWVFLFRRMLAAMRQMRPLEEALRDDEAVAASAPPSRSVGCAHASSAGPGRVAAADSAEDRPPSGMAALDGREIRPESAMFARDGDARPLPRLTVVVAARDEAGEIEGVVRALLAQRYPGLQVVVVDDRSSDGTGAILDRIAQTEEARGRLEVAHNDRRPDGWLGKCWACRLGAERARGEWILFKDGDVTLVGEDLLARVVRFAERRGLDHVAVLPDMEPMPVMQAAVVAAFGQAFLLLVRAHEMDRDLRRGGGGVGAFNLVRRAAYERIGGHSVLRMDPGDDVKLGQLLKESGARQRIYIGIGMVRCPWQRGALGVVRGLEKNGFSGFNYSMLKLVSYTALAAWIVFGPLLSGILGPMIVGAGPLPLAVAWAPAAVLASLAVGGWALRISSYPMPFTSILLYPVAVLVLFAAMWNSAIRALSRGGIEWRGDFYPLDDLKRGLVRPGDGLNRVQAPRDRVGGNPQ